MSLIPPRRGGRPQDSGSGRPRPAPRGGNGARWRRSHPLAPRHAPNVARAAVPARVRARAVVEPPPRGDALDDLIDELADRWAGGERARVEEYRDRVGSDDFVELIYHEFCLAETDGLAPDPAEYLDRFPDQRERLSRLFGLHGALDASDLRDWAESETPPSPLPEAGDEIGPYRLLRELGRGGFARVFLAEQADLGDRLVVLKVAARPSPEPRLLARARHPNIVEVLRHGATGDGTLHLVCMPFLGGATLAAVLADDEGRRRSGRDLVAALDRAAAPEYHAEGAERPARLAIAGLSYPAASAWIVARLAEALDHAFGRGVLHGDLKPSNVLLAADGAPMLFDFNLAVDWRAADAGATGGTGGTLPYMPPERLRLLAGDSGGRPPRPIDRHRADLYALGLILLELATGEPLVVPPTNGEAARGLAARLLELRARPDWWRRGAGRRVPAGLRPILARCLAADPVDRYTRSSELAADLDRWREGRKLAFADDPGGAVGLLRRAHRRRRGLAVAAAAIAVGVALVSIGVDIVGRERRLAAVAKLSAARQRADSGVFRFHHVDRWNDVVREDPAARAWRNLALYDVAGPADWRRRGDVRSLPADDRDDLHAWILEQAYRYGRAVLDHPDSADDWRAARLVLDRAAGPYGLAPIIDLRAELDRRLTWAGPAPRWAAPPPWLAHYVAGVAAEESRAALAFEEYKAAHALRPRHFWPCFRAAAAAVRLHDFWEAAHHLRLCMERYPDNPVLRISLAGYLLYQGSYEAALVECNRAIELDPNLPEAYRSRAFVRLKLGQIESQAADLRRYAMLTKYRGTQPAWLAGIDARIHELGDHDLTPAERDELAARLLAAADPDAIDERVRLATQLARDGRIDEAIAGLDKVIGIDPDHLPARYIRALARRRVDAARAAAEMVNLVAHPRFEELLRLDSRAIRLFHVIAEHELRGGDLAAAVAAASRGLEWAERIGDLRGESHYALARVYAAGVRGNPSLETYAANHFRRACRLTSKPATFVAWLRRDFLIEDRQLVVRLIDGIEPGLR